MQLYQKISSIEAMNLSLELLAMEWTDFDDFISKYDSEVNPENGAKRYSYWWMVDGLGYLLYQDLIDAEMVYQLGGWAILTHWYKWEPIIKEYRERIANPELCIWFEYLGKELEKMRKAKGLPPHPSLPQKLSKL